MNSEVNLVCYFIKKIVVLRTICNTELGSLAWCESF